MSLTTEAILSVDAPSYPEIRLFIAGEWLATGARESSPIMDPATQREIGRLPHATEADLDRALTAAQEGFALWRKTAAYDRSRVIRRAADLLRERIDSIAWVMTLEQGKPLHESRAEVAMAADVFDWFAEEGRRAYGRIIPSRAPADISYSVLRQPVGPVAAFAPWNFPAVIPARKIAASLAAGCSCIIKPAEETPASCLELARALDDAGLPVGVLNVVTGNPARISDYLLRSDTIRKLTFTGSTSVGRQLGALAGGSIKRMTLELGGHAPVLVFNDADIDAAVAQLVATKFRNAGQVCTSPTRFYVQAGVHDAFVERFATKMNRLVVGNGLQDGVQVGPLANPRRIRAMHELIGDAVKCGGRLVTGGLAVEGAGNFWQPSLIANVPNSARIMSEEPFGPVAITASFDTADEALAMANRLPAGLAAYAWTSSLATARQLSDDLECGMLGVNNTAINFVETPFGGVKHSGCGSEGGSEGLDGYLDTKLVSLA
ncbi:MAG: NAD-dependent succinate-semialdehyde dehydrogenase [Rhodanobacter sp.]